MMAVNSDLYAEFAHGSGSSFAQTIVRSLNDYIFPFFLY
jgi:hypothetical protein